ncbi:transmembrane protein 255B-like isoform X2 [Seriola lalandi dorsalis]|uniref:transmembrane protein 255B-like isoform X2 n=1 Tax=Seriola lalandi dorsalis TaxID=1841481 RepID=UPI000C6F9FA9|nr:transmembrane protein 255B-like isoform X2 [Seriola lalandi dorsalis]XP_056229089.1 transmembrane protein 255B isoform X2 [Seriola aureovittata]
MTARIKGAAGRDKPVPQSRATEMIVRVRRALWLVLGMLSLSLLLVVLGVYTTTRTESLNVTGYTSGVILTLGSFLGLLGLRLEENRKQLLTAAIVFLSFGIITSFLCLVIDGVCIVLNMDMRPLRAERCQYYSSGTSYVYENFYTSVSCWNLKESCTMTVRSGTCYCCDLYDCANGGYLNNYYEFVGVRSCEEVFTLYILICTLTGLNLVALFTGILTTAVLGSIKDSGASMYFTPAEKTAASQSFPSASTPHSESNPPPFAPLTSLLPFRDHDLSA